MIINIQRNFDSFAFFRRSGEEQELSAEWSSLVNKAYKVLLTPIQRAEYLLRVNDVNISESNTIDDKVFLMEMMERNEAVTIYLQNCSFRA